MIKNETMTKAKEKASVNIVIKEVIGWLSCTKLKELDKGKR